MGREYSAEELNHLSKDPLIVLFLSMQDQMRPLNINMEKILEQIAAANNHRFGRSTEKHISDLLYHLCRHLHLTFLSYFRKYSNKHFLKYL